MLSYRHAFHAGNHADVLKHLVLVNTLDYLLKKPTPVLYIDTHSGAGMYSLKSEQAQKKAEYKQGVAAIHFDKLPDSAAIYRQLVEEDLQSGFYPGSPELAARILREQDRLRLYEMHSRDVETLLAHFKKDRRVKVEKSDGFASLKALLPAKQMRAVVLIDPSYEIKNDYQKVTEAMQLAYERMPTAVLMLWYPVVRRKDVSRMVTSLKNSAMKDVWQFELAVQKDNEQYGMTASGVFVVNPPWVLADQMRELLPLLQKQLAPYGFWLVEQLVAE